MKVVVLRHAGGQQSLLLWFRRARVRAITRNSAVREKKLYINQLRRNLAKSDRNSRQKMLKNNIKMFR